MTKDDWVHAITMLVDLGITKDIGKCRLCVYRGNCDEEIDCAENIAEYIMEATKEDKE